MKKIILKLNYLIFSFYYKKVPNHFKYWTFFNSISLLIQNYDHLKLLFDNSEKHKIDLIKESDRLRKELSDIRIKEIASDNQIDWLNKSFGANIHKTSEN